MRMGHVILVPSYCILLNDVSSKRIDDMRMRHFILLEGGCGLLNGVLILIKVMYGLSIIRYHK